MYGKIECNRNTKVKRDYRNGLILFLAGAATGVFTTAYLMKKNHKDMLNTISTQADIIGKLNRSNKQRIVEIKDLKERNEAVHHQNQELWLEHARILKRRARMNSIKEPFTKENKNKPNPLVEPVKKKNYLKDSKRLKQ